MNTRALLCVAALSQLAQPTIANEALDILEGRKKIEDAAVTPLPEGQAPLSGAIGATNAEGKTMKPFVPSTPSAFSIKSHEIFDPYWAKTTIIQDEDHPYVQEFSLTGLFEANAVWGEVETTNGAATTKQNVDDVTMRRAQLGARMKAFYRTEITGVAELAGPSRLNGIQTLKARTAISENTGITIGKFRALSTGENNTPDAALRTAERSLLSNMIAPADSLGVMFDAKNKNWLYNLGWFSGDFDDMIPGIKNEGFINVGIAYEQTAPTEVGPALHSRWYLNYLHNLDRNDSQVLPRPGITSLNYKQVVSTGFSFQQDRFGFQGDFTLARGDANSWGVTLMPTYWILPGAVQFVGRYHYADTDQIDGLFGGYGTGADPFFDGKGPIIQGDEYHSFYLGADVHLYENRMILRNGFEYTLFLDELDSTAESESLLWQTGAKISF
jgi:hypothetical protein